jgi:retinol dehydrogenase-12
VYNLSKLISLQWTRAMNAHLPSTLPLVVDMVDPGHCYSGVRRNVTSVQRMLFSVMDFVLARSTPEGAKTLVWAATAGHDDVATRDSLKGAYIGDCQISEPSDFLFTAEGTESEKRVWVSLLGSPAAPH